MANRLLLAIILCSCRAAAEEVGGTVTEWIACPTNLFDCGHVYMCEAEADNDLGHVEICINDDDDPTALESAEAMYGMCEPTPRHQGLCKWCCDGDCGRGVNAYNGNWCP